MRQPGEHIRRGSRLLVECGDVAPDIFVARIAKKRERGLIGAQNDAVGIEERIGTMELSKNASKEWRGTSGDADTAALELPPASISPFASSLEICGGTAGEASAVDLRFAGVLRVRGGFRCGMILSLRAVAGNSSDADQSARRLPTARDG